MSKRKKKRPYGTVRLETGEIVRPPQGASMEAWNAYLYKVGLGVNQGSVAGGNTQTRKSAAIARRQPRPF